MNTSGIGFRLDQLTMERVADRLFAKRGDAIILLTGDLRHSDKDVTNFVSFKLVRGKHHYGGELQTDSPVCDRKALRYLEEMSIGETSFLDPDW